MGTGNTIGGWGADVLRHAGKKDFSQVLQGGSSGMGSGGGDDTWYWRGG